MTRAVLALSALALGACAAARPPDPAEAAKALDRAERACDRPTAAEAAEAAAVLVSPALDKELWDRAHEILVRMARARPDLVLAELFRRLERRDLDAGSCPYVGSALLAILEGNPRLGPDLLARAELLLRDRTLSPFGRGTAAALLGEVVRSDPALARGESLELLLSAVSAKGAFGVYEGAGQAISIFGRIRKEFAAPAAGRLVALLASEKFDEAALLPVLNALLDVLKAHPALADRAALEAAGPVLRDSRFEGGVEKAAELLRLVLEARPDLGGEVVRDFRGILRTKGLPARSYTQAALSLGYIAADAKSPLARPALDVLLETLKADPREVGPESIRETAHGIRPVARWRPGLFDRPLVRTLADLGRIRGAPGMFVGSSVILRDIVQDRPDLTEIIFEEVVRLIDSPEADPASLPSAAGLAVLVARREPDLLTEDLARLLEKVGAYRALASLVQEKQMLLLVVAGPLEERARRGVPDAAEFIGLLRVLAAFPEGAPASLVRAVREAFKGRGWEAADYAVIGEVLKPLGPRLKGWLEETLRSDLDPAARAALETALR